MCVRLFSPHREFPSPSLGSTLITELQDIAEEILGVGQKDLEQRTLSFFLKSVNSQVELESEDWALPLY